MPIYEYKCKKCGSILEILQKLNDPPLEKCPECGGLLKKVISPPAIQFKGSGWYVTDYARKKKPEKEVKAKEKSKDKKKDPVRQKNSNSTPSSD